MQHHLRLIHLLYRLRQFVYFARLLVLLEFLYDLLYPQILILTERLPLASYLFKKYFQYFVQERKNDSLGVLFICEGVGGNGFVGDLDEAEFILLLNGVAGEFGDAGEGLADDKFEGILDFAPDSP